MEYVLGSSADHWSFSTFVIFIFIYQRDFYLNM